MLSLQKSVSLIDHKSEPRLAPDRIRVEVWRLLDEVDHEVPPPGWIAFFDVLACQCTGELLAASELRSLEGDRSPRERFRAPSPVRCHRFRRHDDRLTLQTEIR